jgi:hypothetical protein
MLADIAYRRGRILIPRDIPFEASFPDRRPFFSLEGLSNSFREAWSESAVRVKHIFLKNGLSKRKAARTTSCLS